MPKRPYTGRSRRSAVVTAAVLTGLLSIGAGSAGAFTIGDASVPVSSTSTAFPPFGLAQTTSATSSGVFRFAGTVSTFSTRAYGGDATTVTTVVILRPNGAGGYTVAARSPAITLPATTQLTTGSFPGGQPVLANDLLALDVKDPTPPSAPVLSYAGRSISDTAPLFLGGGFGAIGSTAPNPATPGGFLVVSLSAEETGSSTTTCTQTAVRRNSGLGAHDQSDVTVSNPGGLVSIINTQVTNGAVTVPTFAPGTTGPVIVTTTKATQGVVTRFSFDANDTQASLKHCA
jgi:hypothetical protein